MKYTSSILYLFLLFTGVCEPLRAQELLFGKGIGPNNEVLEASKHWDLDPPKDGVPPPPIEIVASYSSVEALTGKKGYIFIDKELPLGDFEEYLSFKVWVTQPQSVHGSFSLKDAGRYLVYYADERKNILASDTLYVHAAQEIFFCEDVGRGLKPIGRGRAFQPSSTGLYYYYIAARSDVIFDTHQFITEIYQYKVGDYRKPISTATEYVNPEWQRVFFRGPMLKPGQYRVEMKKANGEPFATGYFTLAPPKNAD